MWCYHVLADFSQRRCHFDSTLRLFSDRMSQSTHKYHCKKCRKIWRKKRRQNSKVTWVFGKASEKCLISSSVLWQNILGMFSIIRVCDMSRVIGVNLQEEGKKVTSDLELS